MKVTNVDYHHVDPEDVPSGDNGPDSDWEGTSQDQGERDSDLDD